MKKMISDGWHMAAGYKVYVEDGKILRGILGDGCNQRTAYPYRESKYGGYTECIGITVAAFCSAARRGTAIMA